VALARRLSDCLRCHWEAFGLRLIGLDRSRPSPSWPGRRYFLDFSAGLFVTSSEPIFCSGLRFLHGGTSGAFIATASGREVRSAGREAEEGDLSDNAPSGRRKKNPT